MPGLAEYARVRDWRLGQLARMPNVQIYPDNRLDADAVLELGCQHVFLATGARWRRDGVGRHSNVAFAGHQHENVLAVEQVLRGFLPQERIAIYDDEHYYLGGALALALRAQGVEVTLVSPEVTIGRWQNFTDEHAPVMQALHAAGVEIVTAQELLAFAPGEIRLGCIYSGRESVIEAEFLLPIGARSGNDEIWREFEHRRDEFSASGGLSLQRIGDCLAPGIVAAAVYGGHRAARELGLERIEVKRDRVVAA